MIRSLHFALLALLLSACVTLPRYKEAEPRYSASSVPAKVDGYIIVHLESVFVGKRFDEIVCDNIFGAIWNPEESQKIGFTQNYAEIIPKLLPLMALEASLPYNIGVGRAAAGESTLALDQIKVDSRIMVPFGTYISRNIEQIFSANTRQSIVCFDRVCVEEREQASLADRIATVRFTRFRVAEDKPNRLTLAVEGRVMVTSKGQRAELPIKYEILERRVTSEGYFASDVLRVMDKMANEVSSAIADQVFAAVR